MVMMPTMAARMILGIVWLMKLEMDGRKRTGIQRNIGKMGSGGKGRRRGRTWNIYRTDDSRAISNPNEGASLCLRRRFSEHFHSPNDPAAVALVEEGLNAAGLGGDGLGGLRGGLFEVHHGLRL